MAEPSVCHQFATSITSPVATRLMATLEVRFPSDRILSDNEQGSELDVTLEGRKLGSLQELDEILEESLRSSSHSEEKRNESEFASGIQDLVEPLPQIQVSIHEPLRLGSDGEGFLDALFELVVKFRTKLRIAFGPPYGPERLMENAIRWDKVGLAKLVVAMAPFTISNDSCLCPATVIAKVRKCASTFEVVTLLFAINRTNFSNPLLACIAEITMRLIREAIMFGIIMQSVMPLKVLIMLLIMPRNMLDMVLHHLQRHMWQRRIPYYNLFLKHIGMIPSIRDAYASMFPSFRQEIGILRKKLGSDFRRFNYTIYKCFRTDTMKCFASDISTSYHQNQKLPGVWNLTAEVHGLLLPTRRAWTYTNLNPQVLKLQVSLQPAVTGACSMAIGVLNVQVRIQNASLNSSQSNLLGFFLSHITVSIRPEVEEQQVLLMLLEVPSPNEPYDISATRTIGVSATATGSKNPGVGVTATESSSATIKSTTTDWCHEQTRADEFTGNFSWTLRRLAGVPFNHAQPKCTKTSIFRRRPLTSILDRPFNRDGSVTFSEQCPKTIKWTLAPELAGTDVVWYVSTTVHVTMLDRSTGKGKTLEFWCPDHLLHNMSTDVKQ
jgi:hypothetical protein